MKKDFEYCISEIEKMLSRSTTKVIFPVITFGLLQKYVLDKQEHFSNGDVRENAIKIR